MESSLGIGNIIIQMIKMKPYNTDSFPIGISPILATSIMRDGTPEQKDALETYLQACWAAGYTAWEVIRGPVSTNRIDN